MENNITVDTLKSQQTRERLVYAVKLLRKSGFSPRICNRDIGHIQVGKWNIWARTGKIFHPTRVLREKWTGEYTIL